MYKIRRIKFINHPVLKDLEINFCKADGKAADTILLAGENGTGKSTIIDCLYKIVSGIEGCTVDLELENENNIVTLKYRFEYNSILKNRIIKVYDNFGFSALFTKNSTELSAKYPMSGIFSDVDINFDGQEIATVTTMSLDSTDVSRRSSSDLPTQVKQLLVDIQDLDDAALSSAYREAKQKGESVEKLSYDERMSRFTNAFNYMFEDLTYDRIENVGNHKQVFFKKNGVDISIDNLSSGEKQVVYRGCFLLKDVNATKGAFVFIDEPEISLHPKWQMKIMDYYKGIFSDEYGNQTSQIFAVTHSPFIIHNEHRKNDKVIVLSRNDKGEIQIKDKQEYFKCNSIEVVQDAFLIKDFLTQTPTVYLEGRTDEKYFSKALEVFNYNVPYRFRWIGYIDERGQEVNTGKDSVNRAIQFLIAQDLPIKNVCLLDCDTNKKTDSCGNVMVMSLPKYENIYKITVGIENALVLDDIDIEPFRTCRQEMDGYGGMKVIPEFQKMKFCEYICSLERERLKKVFSNLKIAIDTINEYFS